MIIAPTISSDYFTWTGNVGVAEASDPGISRIMGKRLYDDAADEGFIVRSERTGAKVPFHFHHDERTHDGDIIVSIYVSVPYTGEFEIHILND